MDVEHRLHPHAAAQGNTGTIMRGDCSFHGRNLELARTFRGLTQRELAREVSASDGLISRYENGRLGTPPLDLVEAWGNVLGFEPDFFFIRVHDPFRDEEYSFRSQAVPEPVRKRAMAYGTLVGIVVSYLKKRVGFPTHCVPSVPVDGTRKAIEEAAQRCRTAWALGLDAPITRIGRVVERAGVPIVRMPAPHRTVDAFSRRGRTPVIFADPAAKSPSHWIVDLARELGHLVCHCDVPMNSVEAEQEADAFAGAFLMPAHAFAKDFATAPFSWEHMFSLKARWHVSIEAIVSRAYALDLLDMRRYRGECQRPLARNWGNREPREPDAEEPELLREWFRLLYQRGEHPTEVCQRLHIRPSTFHNLTGEVPHCLG